MVATHAPKKSNPVEIKLHWATLKFLQTADIHLEKLFLQKYFQKNISHVRHCHFYTIFFYLLAGFIDYFLFPDDFKALFSIRFFIVVPVFIIGYLFTYSRLYQKVWQPISFLYILITGWSFIIFTMIAEPPDSYGYYVGILFCMMFGYTFIRERFIYASIAGMILLSSYLITSMILIQMPAQTLLHSSFYLILVNFLGMLISRHLEISARRDFFLEHNLSIEQSKFSDLTNHLEHLVEKRTSELQKQVNERKQAEIRLKESEKKYRLLTENVSDVIWTMDMDLNYTYISPAIEKIQGWSAKEAALLTMKEFLTPESIEIVLARWAKHMENVDKTDSYDITDRFELELYCKDGTTILAEILASFILDEDGKPVGILGVTRDITERNKLETQLQQAQKMEAIGTLAGGVAHDLNNILSAQVSYPDLILMELPDNSPFREPILTIQKSGKKAAAIVQDLLTLARRGVVATDVVNLNNIIDEYRKSPECESLLAFHAGIQISLDLDPGLLNILGSSVHLATTVANLCSNAAEAMTGGGTISISTLNQYIDKPIKGYEDVHEGDYVVLKVIDCGEGISSGELEKIFEPFYTKKVMGRSGTGLGMAVVWGTVKDHHGYIEVQSTEGKGTTFSLYFPVTRKTIDAKDETLSIQKYMGAGESILVVDDVEEQREIVSRILSKLKYHVISVSSGEEAVNHLKDNAADLLILDMLMEPGIDGLETYKRILEIHPDQKAIIASGFTETIMVKEAQQLGVGKYIKKPYTMEKIGLAVKEELEK